jgi:hypothetical protein
MNIISHSFSYYSNDLQFKIELFKEIQLNEKIIDITMCQN